MALRGTNQEFGRPYNRRIVLETIRLHAPITRADIAKRVGLTTQTVANIVREIEEQGFIVLRPRRAEGARLPAGNARGQSRGRLRHRHPRHPARPRSRPDRPRGEVIGRARRDLPRVEPDHRLPPIGAMVAELSALRPAGRMLGVGMAMPGPFGVESMSFVGPTTLEGLERRRAQALATPTGLPAFIEVDLAAAAHGERLYGAGRHFRDFYYLYFGVGLGGSMVHDGAALRGAWAMPARSVICRWCPMAIPVLAAIAAASNAMCRSRRLRAPQNRERRLAREVSAFIPHCRRHHREFV